MTMRNEEKGFVIFNTQSQEYIQHAIHGMYPTWTKDVDEAYLFKTISEANLFCEPTLWDELQPAARYTETISVDVKRIKVFGNY